MRNSLLRLCCYISQRAHFDGSVIYLPDIPSLPLLCFVPVLLLITFPTIPDLFSRTPQKSSSFEGRQYFCCCCFHFQHFLLKKRKSMVVKQHQRRMQISMGCVRVLLLLLLFCPLLNTLSGEKSMMVNLQRQWKQLHSFKLLYNFCTAFLLFKKCTLFHKQKSAV